VYENTFVGSTFRDGQSFPQSQRLVREDGVYLTLLTGSISDSRSGSVGVDINATHRSEPVEGVSSITIPSQFNNETWENQILEGQGNVENVDNAGDGRVEITFSESLEVSCAVVGLNSDPGFTPPKSESENENEPVGGNASVFDTQWENNSLVEVKPGGSVTLTMEATERGVTPRRPIENATVDFAEEGEGGADIFDSINPQGDVTDSNGTQDLVLEIANGTIENQSRIYATAGDDSDVLTLSVVGYKVDIESTNSPVAEGETLEVTATVENTRSVSETQTVNLTIEGVGVVDSESVTLDGGTSESVTFTWQTASGDAGDYTATVSSEDDSDSTDVTVDSAPDLGPTFDTLEAEVTDTGGQGQINEIRLDYQLDPNEVETIEFRVYNDEARADLIDNIERESAGEEYIWAVDRGGQDRVPVYIEADIAGGECLTAELEQDGSTAVLADGDWEDC
jgi:hypothetical protein